MSSVNKPVYPLIPPQEMIQYMLKYSFFHKQVTQIPDSIIVSSPLPGELIRLEAGFIILQGATVQPRSVAVRP